MIEATQFEHQFDKLCAAFGTTKTSKIKDVWFEEFGDCDYFTFCRAVKILQGGDRFPNWGMVWDTYRPILPPHLRSPVRKGCNDCVSGRVFFVDYIADRDRNSKNGVMAYSLVGNCGLCSKDAISDLNNVDRKDMVRADNGEYWTVRAMDKLPEEQKKVEEWNKKAAQAWRKDKHRMRGQDSWV